MGIKELLIPKDTIFFDLFERQAGLLNEAAWQLVALTEDFTNVKEKRHEIEKLEHQGDQITHDIYEQLNRTFITPLDPEEISRLASTLDEVLDYIDGSAEKMFYYNHRIHRFPHDRTGKTNPSVNKRDRKCSEKYPFIQGFHGTSKSVALK